MADTSSKASGSSAPAAAAPAKAPAPYVPAATAASERMADSVMSRNTPMTLLEGYQPSEVVRAGLRTRETPELASPLWGMLPAVKLEPVVAALESALGVSPPVAEKPQPKETAGSGPSLTLVQPPPSEKRRGQSEADEKEPAISRTAMEASMRLLDALRAHASAHAAAGAGRVSLGDMQTISFAESNNQLAAAGVNESTPDGPEPDTVAPQFPNPKIYTDQNDFHYKMNDAAQKLFKEIENEDRIADIRHGDS